MSILLIILITLVFYYIQSKEYGKRCFNKLTITIKFKDESIFEGETTEISEVVINKKLLNIWWLITQFRVSNSIIFLSDSNEAKGDSSYRKDLFSVLSFQKIMRSFKIKAIKRGYYVIKDLDVIAGDLFVKNKYLKSYNISTYLYVYPLIINNGDYKIPFEKMMGEIMSKRKMIEDPFLIRGIRDYMQFDSFKYINWKASAKEGELRVNEYDFTASREIVILLNIEKFNEWDGEAIIEESIRIAASIYSELLNSGVSTELISNGYNIVTGERIRIDSSININSKEIIFKQLACIDDKRKVEPFTKIFDEILIDMKKSPLYILISQYFGQDLQNKIDEVKSSGYNLLWVLPKNTGTILKIKNQQDIFIWEVLQK